MNFFSSVRLTVVLLTILAATSILGTIIPQNIMPSVYMREYGHIFYRLFDFIELFDMYHSKWFQLMLFLLAMNIVICTFKRLPGAWKLIFSRNANTLRKFKKFSQSFEIKSDKNLKTICDICDSAILREFRSRNIVKLNDGVFFIETGRLTRIAVHVVHISVVFLLVGGLLGSIYGFEGYVNVAEGDTVQSIKLKKSNKTQTLDFGIRCDSFDIKFYKNGTPKEYKSKLTLVKNDLPVAVKHVIVNDPMCYDGVNIFQSSYGKIPFGLSDGLCLPEILEINFKNNNSGKTYTKELRFGIMIDLPEGLGRFCVLDYEPDASFNGMKLGGVLKCVHLFIDNESPEEILLPIDFPNFDLMRGGVMVASVSNQLRKEIKTNNSPKRPLYYTGLQVTKDPGKWLVYTGFSLMFFGFIVTLLMSHKQVYIKVAKDGNIHKIIMTGHSNRNKLAMKMILERMREFVFCRITS